MSVFEIHFDEFDIENAFVAYLAINIIFSVRLFYAMTHAPTFWISDIESYFCFVGRKWFTVRLHNKNFRLQSSNSFGKGNVTLIWIECTLGEEQVTHKILIWLLVKIIYKDFGWIPQLTPCHYLVFPQWIRLRLLCDTYRKLVNIS